MLMQCRFCKVSKNGEFAIRQHERESHPQEYYSIKADNLEQSARRNIEEANKLREKYSLSNYHPEEY